MYYVESDIFFSSIIRNSLFSDPDLSDPWPVFFLANYIDVGDIVFEGRLGKICVYNIYIYDTRIASLGRKVIFDVIIKDDRVYENFWRLPKSRIYNII